MYTRIASHNSDQSAQVQTSGSQAGQTENFQQTGRLRDLGCQQRLRRINHRAAEEEIHQLHSNGVHHDRAQDFIYIEISFEITCNSTPECPTNKSCQDGKDDHQPNREGW